MYSRPATVGNVFVPRELRNGIDDGFRARERVCKQETLPRMLLLCVSFVNEYVPSSLTFPSQVQNVPVS